MRFEFLKRHLAVVFAVILLIELVTVGTDALLDGFLNTCLTIRLAILGSFRQIGDLVFLRLDCIAQVPTSVFTFSNTSSGSSVERTSLRPTASRNCVTCC